MLTSPAWSPHWPLAELVVSLSGKLLHIKGSKSMMSTPVAGHENLFHRNSPIKKERGVTFSPGPKSMAFRATGGQLR